MKQSELLPKGRYSSASDAVLFSDRISPSDKLVYICLLKRLGPSNERCWPTQAELAMQCNLSIKTVARCIEKLDREGFISVERAFGHGADIYSFCDPENPVPHSQADRKSPPISWKARRIEVLERDSYQCRYCGDPADTVDHMIPGSRGGTDEKSNLVAACGSCNSAKRDRTPAEAGFSITPDIGGGI